MWEPYLDEQVLAMPLNPMCRRDKDLWSVRCPLICFYAIEIHLPHRVARQFGLLQSWPPKEVSPSTELHKYVFWLPIYGFILFMWLTIAVQLICRFDRHYKKSVDP